MNPRRRTVWVLALLLVSGVLVLSCGRKATPTPTPTMASPAPTGTPISTADLLNRVFPPGDGRELVIENCLNCHGLGAIVLKGSQKDATAWAAHRAYHERSMVVWLTAAEKDRLWGYLVRTFGPGKPAPELPSQIELFYRAEFDQPT